MCDPPWMRVAPSSDLRRRWIPFLIVAWSVVAGSQAFIYNKASFYTLKALLGLLMGGFIP